MLPTAQRHGMGILTYSPLGGGWLSGSWSADSSPASPARRRLAARFDMSLPANQRKLQAVEQLQQVADDAGLSMIELAIGFDHQPRRHELRRAGPPAASAAPLDRGCKLAR